MIRRRGRRGRTTTRTDNNKDFCGDEVMVMRRRTTRKRRWRFVWFPSDNTLFIVTNIQYG